MINEESLERRRRREVEDADVDELDDATKQSQNKKLEALFNCI